MKCYAPTLDVNGTPVGSPGSVSDRTLLGLSQVSSDVDASKPLLTPVVAEVASVTTDVRDLRFEIGQLQAERDRVVRIQQQIMDLLGTRSPDRLLHDLRNILNERDLFRTLAETVM